MNPMNPMNPINSNSSISDPNATGTHTSPEFEAKILRLVKGKHEIRAVKLGQVDAILDPDSGQAILLPKAHTALLEHKSQFRSLVDLASDGYWEQDEHYYFVAYHSIPIGNGCEVAQSILGKTLWELSFNNDGEVDWQTFRTQLEWRAVFRDLELSYVDGTGRLRIIGLSGEPRYDSHGQFTGYCGIVRDITVSKLSEKVTARADHLADAALDALTAQVCVLDGKGTIIATNRAWRVFATCHAADDTVVAEGSHYRDASRLICGNVDVDATALAAGIHQVIAGERGIFRCICACLLSAGQGWFMVTVTQVKAARAARAIISCEDITSMKRVEQLSRLENTVFRCLADATSTPAAIQDVIRMVCESQQWQCGRYFQFDAAAGVLALAESWCLADATVKHVMGKLCDAVARPGAGLVGRVYQSGQPLWIVNGSNNVATSQTALAHEVGMQGAFVFPVRTAKQTVGVLAFASHFVQEPDDQFLQTVLCIGQQLGNYLHRQEVATTLRESEIRLRRLVELSTDWVWELDSNYRFTKLVGSGMPGTGDILGKTLWELPNIVLSADEWIRYKSELTAQWSFIDFECAAVIADGELCYYHLNGEPMYDASGVFYGFHGTGVDITKHKHAASVLCEMKRSKVINPLSKLYPL
jgi:PAS domain-containing protein